MSPDKSLADHINEMKVHNGALVMLLPWPGCTDGSCAFGHPGGMHTNGGCKCVASLSEMKHWTPSERIALRDKIKALAASRSALLSEVRRLREAGERVRRAFEAHAECREPECNYCHACYPGLRASVEALGGSK